jgi:hypothetical protein
LLAAWNLQNPTKKGVADQLQIMMVELVNLSGGSPADGC